MSLPANRAQTMRGLAPGTWLGDYEVVRRIGSGGMAELYLGRLDGPQGYAIPVALKLMHAHLVDDPDFVRMFQREAKIAAALEHSCIVRILDVGCEGGEHFLALEYVHGVDLRRLLAAHGRRPLPLALAIRIVLEVGEALDHAHCLCDARGRPLQIVHRDVSPSNVLISFAGAVKLADFGVARMVEQTQATATNSLKGKVGYMSPEQCMQDALDARSDIFSLGVVLYEATTGHRAFAGEAIACMNRVIDGQWTHPDRLIADYPERLGAIVSRAMARDVDDRYASVMDLCADLQSFAVTAELDTHPERLAEFLADLYGPPTPPNLRPTVPAAVVTPGLESDALPADPTTQMSVSVRRRVSGRRRWRIAGLAVLSLGMGMAGWQVATRTAAPIAELGDELPASTGDNSESAISHTPIPGGTVEWSHVLTAKTGYGRFGAVQLLADGDVVAMGTQQVVSADLLLVRLRPGGELVEQRTHDVAGHADEVEGATQDADGRLWVCGRGDSGTGGVEGWIGRFDASLTQPPSVQLSLDHQRCRDIEQIAFDTIVAVGDDYEAGGGAWTYTFPPWDPQAGTTTSKTVGTQSDMWLAVARAVDGTLLLGGRIVDRGVVAPIVDGAPGAALVKSDALGAIQGLAANGTGFVAGGYEVLQDPADAWVMASTPNGEERWTWRPERPSPLGDEIEAVAIDTAGNVAAVGFTGTGDRRRWVVRLDPSGKLLWSVVLPVHTPNGHDIARDVVLLPSGDLIVVGEVEQASTELAPWVARMTK